MSPALSCRLAGCILAILMVWTGRAAETSPKDAQINKGKLLYLQHCVLCHQSSGQGSVGTFPPLAGSDFLAANRERTIRAVVEGLSGAITVKGTSYNGFMPPVVLNDEQAANVLTFVHNSWGNSGEAISAEEVKRVRAKSAFPTFEALAKANAYAPLPKAPEGFELRELVRLQNNATRLASDGQGKILYALSNNGDIWRIDIEKKILRQILSGARYIDLKKGDPSVVGFTLDSQNRFYIVVNQRNDAPAIVTNEVTIYRTTAQEGGDPAKPEPWFHTSYPWGIGPFNHGVGNVGLGPDGYLYVSSGSRTDGSESGNDPRYSMAGEAPITACVWRFDPRAEKPELEIFARGVRNPYGFCWNDKGEMFATENGPNADAPEELNFIQQGKHYGFPYQFSDWKQKPYPYTPDAPAGLQITQPIANLGPDGGFNGKPLYTFNPHSSPAGIVFLGNEFPPDYRGTFFVVRFGILLEQPADYGFDLLQVRLQKNSAGIYEAKIKTVLAPLARPLDVHLSGKGKVYILEYCRAIDSKGSLGLPGRILELSAKK